MSAQAPPAQTQSKCHSHLSFIRRFFSVARHVCFVFCDLRHPIIPTKVKRAKIAMIQDDLSVRV